MLMIQSKNQKKIEQALKISRLYYIDEMSQSDIAKKLQISRPTISRLLQFAKENNIVEVKIHDPFQNVESIRKQLQAKYHLKDAIIGTQTNTNENNILKYLGQQTADYLDKIIRDNDIIGISWGKTMEAIANSLNDNFHKNIEIVQLKGSVTNSQESNYSSDITQKFSRAFHTQAEILPLPVIFDDVTTKNLVVKDRFINNVLEKGFNSNIAIYTVGTTLPTAMLFRLGYLDKEKIDHIKKVAVGDILSRFITDDGMIADKELDSRTVSIPLDNLKHKKYSILIAGGRKKLASIHAALMGGYPNVLITDLITAKDLLNQ